MIAEDYVSFETAKLLKEKEFDCECRDCYNIDGHFYSEDFKSNWNNSKGELTLFSAPTLQLTMKWLREVHNLHCAVDYDFVLGWYCQITNLKETVKYDYEEMKHYHPDKNNGFSSSEQAYEESIKYCLENLI